MTRTRSTRKLNQQKPHPETVLDVDPFHYQTYSSELKKVFDGSVKFLRSVQLQKYI